MTTHLENLDKSGNSKVVREKSGKMKKSGKSQRKLKSVTSEPSKKCEMHCCQWKFLKNFLGTPSLLRSGHPPPRNSTSVNQWLLTIELVYWWISACPTGKVVELCYGKCSPCWCHFWSWGYVSNVGMIASVKLTGYWCIGFVTLGWPSVRYCTEKWYADWPHQYVRNTPYTLTHQFTQLSYIVSQ